jgi:hypothetical protein
VAGGDLTASGGYITGTIRAHVSVLGIAGESTVKPARRKG